MKKVLSFALTMVAVGSTLSQMVIPGESFAKNPASFNGRKVSVKNIQITATQTTAPGVIAPAPINPVGTATVAPGANGTGTQVIRCNVPRGYKQLDVNFLAAPDFEGCFFTSDAMYKSLAATSNGTPVDAQITFQGDNRLGYNVTFYRIGK